MTEWAGRDGQHKPTRDRWEVEHGRRGAGVAPTGPEQAGAPNREGDLSDGSEGEECLADGRRKPCERDRDQHSHRRPESDEPAVDRMP